MKWETNTDSSEKLLLLEVFSAREKASLWNDGKGNKEENEKLEKV